MASRRCVIVLVDSKEISTNDKRNITPNKTTKCIGLTFKQNTSLKSKRDSVMNNQKNLPSPSYLMALSTPLCQFAGLERHWHSTKWFALCRHWGIHSVCTRPWGVDICEHMFSNDAIMVYGAFWWPKIGVFSFIGADPPSISPPLGSQVKLQHNFWPR